MKTTPFKILIVGSALMSAVIASEKKSAGSGVLEEARAIFGTLPSVPEGGETAADAALGRALFWDERLSANGRTACASCHLISDWGADRRPFSPDARGNDTKRNSQTVLNALLQPSLRWTGDRTSGAHQAEKSLTGSMGFAEAGEVVPLLHRHGYAPAFEKAWPEEADPVTSTNYAKALQAYQATLVSLSAFDRFLGGDPAALTAPQQHGLRIFIDSDCTDCHKGSLLGGGAIRKFGVVKDYRIATKSEKNDAGLFETTRKEEDRDKFRVPMLRNIEKTGPYFHDGSVADLNEAVQVMADVQTGTRLPEAEADAIVEFLKSLTGEIPVHYSPPRQPTGGEKGPATRERGSQQGKGC